MKNRRTLLCFRKRDDVHNLLAAVQRFVRSNGGDLVVVGGIEIQHSDSHRFKVAVSCTGRAPSRGIFSILAAARKREDIAGNLYLNREQQKELERILQKLDS